MKGDVPLQRCIVRQRMATSPIGFQEGLSPETGPDWMADEVATTSRPAETSIYEAFVLAETSAGTITLYLKCQNKVSSTP